MFAVLDWVIRKSVRISCSIETPPVFLLVMCLPLCRLEGGFYILPCPIFPLERLGRQELE